MSRTVLKNDLPHVRAAFADLGLSEIVGKRHERRVLALYADAGHPEVKDDETAWCAAAVGAWLHRAGYPNSGSLMARSYAKYGVACDLKKRVPRGAIAVWPRGRPPSGHVNLVLEDDGQFLTCIGGNQSNGSGGGVTISRERKIKAIACRMPPGVKPVAVPLPPSKPVALMQDVEDSDTAEPLPPEQEPTQETPQVDHGDPTIMSVQKRLRELGYFEIGEPDGGTGGMARTQGAILAFRNDNDLGLSPEIDDELLAALAKASPRKVSEARATATVEDLRDKGSTTITLTDRIKKAAGWLLGSAVVGGGASGGDVIDTVTNGATKIGGFKRALDYVGIGIGAVVLLGVAALVIWYFADRAQKNRVIEYQKGKNT